MLRYSAISAVLKKRKVEIIKYKLINDKGNAYTIVKISIHKER